MTRTAGTRPKDRRRVAVIGSGLAGLTTAYLLRQEGVEVWLIEKSDKLGFHSASVSIPLDNGDKQSLKTSSAGRFGVSLGGTVRPERLAGPQRHALQRVEEEPIWAEDAAAQEDEWVADVPMRSFQGGYYPLLISLYHHLGLPLIPCNFTFSFSRIIPSTRQTARGAPSSDVKSKEVSPVDVTSTQTYFLHSGSSGLAFPSLPSVAFTSPLSFVRHTLHFLVVAVCYVLYLLLCFLVYHSILPRSRPFSNYITALTRRLNHPIPLLPLPSTRLGSAWQSFAHDIVLPLFSAVGTMSAADVLAMPMGVMADYVHATVGTTHWRLSADTGAREVARRLLKPVVEQGSDHVRLGTQVKALKVAEGEGGVRVVLGGEEIQVDTVILATPAGVTAKLLAGMLDEGRDGCPQRLIHELERLDKARQALIRVREADTVVVTHRDISILPAATHDIRDIDLLQPVWPTIPTPSSSSHTIASKDDKHSHMPRADCFPATPDSLAQTYTSGTHLIRPPAHFASQAPVLQTTNPVVPIDPRHVLATARMRRALPSSDPDILADLSHPSTQAGTSSETPLVLFAGAYAYPGIPLLEGCVGSALRATRTFIESIDGEKTLQAQVQTDRIGGIDWTTGLGGKWGRLWRARRKLVGEVF